VKNVGASVRARLADLGLADGVGLEKSERFLWDVRLTAQDLVLENHAQRV